MNIITGGVTAPKGFQAAGIHCGIKDNFTTPQPDKKDLAMILSSVPCAAAARIPAMWSRPTRDPHQGAPGRPPGPGDHF